MYSQLQYNFVHHIDGITIKWFWNSLLYSLSDNLIYDISWCRPVCNRRVKKVFVHSICTYSRKTLWCLFQKLSTEMNLSCKVHSAWKHNISGLLELNKYKNKQIIWHSSRKHNISGLLKIIEIHKYTSQRHSVQNQWKASLLVFVINPCSFVHSGLNEVWSFGMLTLLYDVASTWRLVYVFNQWYIRYLFDTAFSQLLFWSEILQH